LGALNNLDAVYVVLLFIVPGYIFLSIRNQFVPGRERVGAAQLYAFITYSAINFAAFGWLIYLAFAYNLNPALKVVAWTLIVGVIPTALGVISGYCSQKEFLTRFYSKLKLNPIHPVDRAWDYVFFNQPTSWVIVVLKSGTQFGGVWDSKSFASSDTKERDLFITEVYEIAGDGPWRPTGKSLFIAAGEIRTIEFIPQK